MTLLKKIGTIVAQTLNIVLGFGPLVSQLMPASATAIATVGSDLSQIGQIIMSVEAVGVSLQLSGPQKLTAAGPLVAQVIMQSALLANHKIADEAAFKAACAGIASNMADLLNSLHDNVQTESKT